MHDFDERPQHGRRIDIGSLEAFDRFAAQAGSMRGWRIQDVDLRERGAELERLDGSGALLPGADLSCLRAAVIELHPQWIGQDGVQKVFDAMHRAGLTYFPRASEGKVVTFLKGW